MPLTPGWRCEHAVSTTVSSPYHLPATKQEEQEEGKQPSQCAVEAPSWQLTQLHSTVMRGEGERAHE